METVTDNPFPGGISFYTNRRGFVCDNVAAITLVLANGTITTASSTSSPELFRALRGGGQSNFGVVTSFTLDTFPLANSQGLWDASRFYTWDQLEKILELNHELRSQGFMRDRDTGGFNAMVYIQENDIWMISDRYVHTTHPTVDTWPDVYAEFKDLEVVQEMSTVQIANYSAITISIAAQSSPGSRTAWGTMSYRTSLEADVLVVNLMMQYTEEMKGLAGLQSLVVMQPLLAPVIGLMAKRGGNVLGLEEEDGPLTMLVVGWSWEAADDDGWAHDVFYRFEKALEEKLKSLGVWNRYLYGNYANGGQNVYQGYGEEARKFLIQVQKEVDPKGVFSRDGLVQRGFPLQGEPQRVNTKGAKRPRRKEHGKESEPILEKSEL
jgi:hypothetical protein